MARCEAQTRWRATAEGLWDPATGRCDGWSHTEWFDPAGRPLGEEWRRWARPGPLCPETAFPGADRPRRNRPTRQSDDANRVADRLMLAAGLVTLLAGLALRALPR